MENGADYIREAELLKALSHPLRLRIVRSLLHSGCRNVGCMERGTGMSQSCISQHLQRLRAAGIVETERVGNEVYYRVTSEEAARVVEALFAEQEDDHAL